MTFTDRALSRRLERAEGYACAQHAAAHRRVAPDGAAEWMNTPARLMPWEKRIAAVAHHADMLTLWRRPGVTKLAADVERERHRCLGDRVAVISGPSGTLTPAIARVGRAFCLSLTISSFIAVSSAAPSTIATTRPREPPFCDNTLVVRSVN